MEINIQEIPFEKPPLDVETVQLVELGYNEYFVRNHSHGLCSINNFL